LLSNVVDCCEVSFVSRCYDEKRNLKTILKLSIAAEFRLPKATENSLNLKDNLARQPRQKTYGKHRICLST